MMLEFTKMHGLGNDFVVLDATTGEPALDAAQIRMLGDRRRGVGFDQLLVATGPGEADADIGLDIYNADGSPAEQCGNGVRCFAAFARARGLVARERIGIATPGGVVRAELGESAVRVDMGRPRLEPDRIPLRAPARALTYPLEVDGTSLELGAVSMGNPHGILAVPDAGAADVARLGPAVQAAGLFPEGVNVGFAEVAAPDRIRLRVYERGVGETLACGSGACAAVVWGRLALGLGPRVTVELPGGDLEIEWDGEGAPVWMSGPVAWAFEGRVTL